MFVTFESKDGGGKSTRAEDLKTRLESQGKKVYLKHFPDYDAPIGHFIGEYLKGMHGTITFEALQMLYVADQLSFQKELEEKLFDEKAIVICDRYDLSTLAYFISKTGCSLQNGIDLVRNRWQSELRKPDITFVIDFKGDLDERRAGMNKDKDVIENDSVIMDNINNIYMSLAKSMEHGGDRSTYIIDGSNTPAYNSDFVYRVVDDESNFITKYSINNREFKNKKIEPFGGK